MKNLLCSVCSGKDYIVPKYADDRPGVAANLFGKYEIHLCGDCGFAEAHPKPNRREIDLYYKYVYGNPRKTPLEKAKTLLSTNQFEYLNSRVDFQKIYKVLDFGAGDACLLRRIRMEYDHIDTSIVEKSLIRRRLVAEEEPKLIRRIYEDINYKGSNYPSNKMNLIISSHSLEHVINIRSTLEKFYTMGNPGSLLFIEVPDCDPQFHQDKLGHPHLSFFTLESLIMIIEQLKFEVLDSVKEKDYSTQVSCFDKKKGVIRVVAQQEGLGLWKGKL